MKNNGNVLNNLKNTWWFAWVVAVMLALSQLKDSIDGLDSLLVLVQLKPDSLALAKSVEKGTFSRELTECAWRRLFWARAYIARISRGASPSETSEAWKSYVSASEEWATHIMIYIVTTERFYGSDKSSELEVAVQHALDSMAQSLVELHYSQAHTEGLIAQATHDVDVANSSLYKFVRGVSSSP